MGARTQIIETQMSSRISIYTRTNLARRIDVSIEHARNGVTSFLPWIVGEHHTRNIWIVNPALHPGKKTIKRWTTRLDEPDRAYNTCWPLQTDSTCQRNAVHHAYSNSRVNNDNSIVALSRHRVDELVAIAPQGEVISVDTFLYVRVREDDRCIGNHSVRLGCS